MRNKKFDISVSEIKRKIFRNQSLLQSSYVHMQRLFDPNISKRIPTGREFFNYKAPLRARSRICENVKQITFFESNTSDQRWAVESPLLERVFAFSR